MTRLISLIVLAALLIAFGVTFFQFVAPFLLPLFLAAITALLCRPVYSRLLARTRNRPYLAAGLTTALLLTIILVPLVVGTTIATAQLFTFARTTFDSDEWQELVAKARTEVNFDHLAERIEQITGEKMTADELQHNLQERFKALLLNIAQRTVGAAGMTVAFVGDAVGLLVSAFIYILGVYYFLADGPSLLAASQKLVPLHMTHQTQLLKQFDQVVRAVVFATFAAALGQGLATGIALLVLRFPHSLILTIVACLTALVPFLGTWLVWAPAAAYLAFKGRYVEAGLLAAYGAIFVGFLDNLIRTYVLNSNVSLHPLLALVSVLGGLQTMGLWGVFIGPIVASVLHALAKILNAELLAWNEERRSDPAAASPSAISMGQMAAVQRIAAALEPLAAAAPAASVDNLAPRETGDTAAGVARDPSASASSAHSPAAAPTISVGQVPPASGSRPSGSVN